MLAVAAGFSPLDDQLQLRDPHRSEGVLSQALWLSGLVEFARVEEILARIGGIELSRTSVWRCAQQWGSRMAEVLATEQAHANQLPVLGEPPQHSTVKTRRMGVAMDGTMIPIRQEGWKELKVGSVFEVALVPSVDDQTKEMVELAHAVNNSYVAHLGGPDIMGEMTWAEAHRRGWEQANDTLAIGDGAPWIWNQVALHFGTSYQLIDWYHAKEHLADAGRLLKGNDTPAFRRWFNSRETQLYQGHAAAIASELNGAAANQPADKAEKLQREAAYFHVNQHRMNYLEMREDEWTIGSGMVESAGKQFKRRFCGPGMHWSRAGAEHMLPIRCAILSDRFDALWNKTYLLPLN